MCATDKMTVHFVFTWKTVKNIHNFWKQNQAYKNYYNHDYWKRNW